MKDLRLRNRFDPHLPWSRSGRLRVGWVAPDTLDGWMTRFRKVPPPFSMRINNLALWLNRHSDDVANELYRPERRYDVVVFFRAMDARAQAEAGRIQAYGGRVVFDANVNYYEVWGDYDIVDTRPTETQRAAAVAMTTSADWVVADSSYLLGVVRRFNPRACWIPDNVDTTLFRPGGADRPGGPFRVVWSGVAKKARPLLAIRSALASLRNAELVVVSDREPDVLPELREALVCRFLRFTEPRYARVLRGCDVIVSPKRLTNAYELGHTEYKITLGMAAGLPAIASPQQSYVEAISHAGGGIIAESEDDWRAAFDRLLGDDALRRELGARARRTVSERYATPVVAQAYREVLCSLA